MASIIVEEDNPTFDSRDNCHAIINTASNTLVFGCKNTHIPNSVTSIGNGAFSGCRELTSITIPNNVNNIGKEAFKGCGLTTITIPTSITNIPENAFLACRELVSVSIPNTVTNIGIGAFSECALTSITIPNSVTKIERLAFKDCNELTNLTIPNSLVSIGKDAFYFNNDDGKLVEIYSLITEPKDIDEEVFHNDIYANATLHVCQGSLNKYKSCKGWSNFKNIEESIPLEIKRIGKCKATEHEWYSLDGKSSSTKKLGMNIVRMSDKSFRKVVIK